MTLQEMPEKSENETEEPTEMQESSAASPMTVSDEELSSDDSASSDVPVDEDQSSESDASESDTANQAATDTASGPEQETPPETSSKSVPDDSASLDVPVEEDQPSESDTSQSESDTRDQAASDADSDSDQEDLPESSSRSDPENSAWYVIHCYSGYENKVRHNLEQRIETMGMKDKIFDVVIPTQEEIEVKDGKRRTVERHIFPGYVLVNLELSEESWYVVRNTPGVTGFVGMGNTPTPLRPEEVSQIIKRMEADAPTVKVTYKVGERVRIVDGPFNDFRGIVSEIDMERTKVRVNVSFFGRETPVELDFLQVEKA
jgi:transcriptional antiterminator NusG